MGTNFSTSHEIALRIATTFTVAAGYDMKSERVSPLLAKSCTDGYPSEGPN